MSGNWTFEKIYTDGDLYFRELIASIDQARSAIAGEIYIFNRDVIGCRVLQALERAAKRGVRVRLLLDGLGSHHWDFSRADEMRKKGIELEFYHPLFWQRREKLPWHWLFPVSWLDILWKLNRRNHRKCWVFDEEIAYLGGLNISDESSREVRGEQAWRDTGVQLRGSPVSFLVQAFEHSWKARNGIRWAARLPKVTDPVRINLARRQWIWNYRDLIRRVHGAQNRIWLTNPYFVPEFRFLRALLKAAERGVDVRVLVPAENDLWAMKWAVQAYYVALLTKKARVFEYQKSILHAKTILIDDWATIGSSNLDSRSVFHDLEVDAVITQNENKEKMAHQFLADLEDSSEVSLSQFEKRSRWVRVLEKLMMRLEPWL
jgi:cardiolipin synthase